MRTSSSTPKPLHEKLRGQRDRAASRIGSLGEQIKEARGISKRHLEAGRDELHAKKELLIEQMQEKRKFIMLTRRQLISQLKILSSKDVIQNQRRRKDIKDDFFFANKSKYWERMPRSMFKTFQELHCARRYWTIPKREGDWGGVNPHQLPLAHTVVDPSRVSAHFLEHFDIPEKSLLDGQNDSVQEYLTARENVDNLKAFYQEHIHPLPDFGYESKNPNFRILVVHNHSLEHDGEIIHPRTKTSKKDKEKDIALKEPAIFRDAYSLFRKTGYMDNTYDCETPQLKKALQAVNAIHKKLGDISADDLKEEKSHKRRVAKRSLLRKPQIFKRVRDDDKVEAREALEATDLTDSLGKVNPTAAQARLAKVRDRVESRKGSIRRITGITDGDREQLEEVILQSENFLLQYGEACKNFHDGNSFAYRKEGKLVPVLRPDLTFSKLKLRPFRFYATKLLELDQAVYSLSRRGKIEEQKKEYLKGYVVCQVFKVQKAFEDCLADVSLKNGFTKKELVQKARELYKTAKSNQVEGYEAIFNHLMEIVNEIGVLLSENPDKLDRETLRIAFKEYLKSIDFQAVLGEVV